MKMSFFKIFKPIPKTVASNSHRQLSFIIIIMDNKSTFQTKALIGHDDTQRVEPGSAGHHRRGRGRGRLLGGGP